MKRSFLWALFSLFVLTVPFAAGAVHNNKHQTENTLKNTDADRLLLVAFSDRSINAIKGTASPTSYRQRGQYGQGTTWSTRVTNQLADDYQLEKVIEWPMTQVGMHCVVYRLPDKASVAQAIQRLSKDDRVELVQNMHLFKTKGTSETGHDPYFKLQTNLQLMQVDLAHLKATGKNVKIGMIDTGVDLTHPDLQGQISRDENFAKEMSPDFNTDKHGTAVAGIMVAKHHNGQGITGIAPNANLFVYKACWPEANNSMAAQCNTYTLALALNTAIKEKVNVLNMSLTGPQDPLLTVLIDKALAEGIIIVAADSGSKDAAENFPASMKNVIAVQASTADPKAITALNTVAAPGNKVLTTLPHGTYDFISGSSIAAAEISGVIALLLEQNSSLSPGNIQAVLSKSKIKTETGEIAGINANVALSTLCAMTSCSDDVLSAALPSFLHN